MSCSGLLDLTGQRFGMLEVLTESDRRGRDRMWLCKCDCGQETLAPTSALRSGNKKSCGCLLDGSFTNNKRLYNVWNAMLQRCNNPNNIRYHRYGGRGISVCDEWSTFKPFLKWALESGYDESAGYGECTLDRIDIDGDYAPENCKWVTLKEQNRNTSTNHFIEIDSVKMTLAEASEVYGVNYNTLKTRLRSGWDVKKAVETPPLKRSIGRPKKTSQPNVI